MNKSSLALTAAVAVTLGACTVAGPNAAPGPGGSPVPGASPAASATGTPALGNVAATRAAVLGAAKPALPAAPAKHLAGIVSYGGPVAGATVTVIGPDGQAVGAPLTTNERGVFERPAAGLPATFTLEATGGKVGDRTLGNRLQALVNKFDANHDFVTVCVASSLAAKAAAGKLDADVEELTNLAESALGARHLLLAWHSDRDIDHAAIEADVTASGSFDAWLMARASQLLSHSLDVPGKSSPFGKSYGKWPYRVAQSADAGEFGAHFLAGKLANRAFNEFMKSIGQSGAEQQDVLDAIEWLHEQSAEIDQHVADALREIKAWESRTTYNALLTPDFREAIGTQDVAIDTLAHITQLGTGSKAAQDDREEFLYDWGKLMAKSSDPLSLWDQALSGTSASTPTLPKEFNAFNASLGQMNGAIWGSKQAAAMEAWWDTLDAELAYSAMLTVQYYNAVNKPELATAAMQKWADVRTKALTAGLRGTTRRSDTIDFAAIGRGTVTTQNPAFLVPGSLVRSKYSLMMYGTGRTCSFKDATRVLMDTGLALRQQTGLEWSSPSLDEISRFTERPNRPAKLYDALEGIEIPRSPGMSVWLRDFEEATVFGAKRSYGTYANEWFKKIPNYLASGYGDTPTIYFTRSCPRMTDYVSPND